MGLLRRGNCLSSVLWDGPSGTVSVTVWMGSLANLLPLGGGCLQSKAEIGQRGHRCPVIRLRCYIQPVALWGPVRNC